MKKFNTALSIVAYLGFCTVFLGMIGAVICSRIFGVWNSSVDDLFLSAFFGSAIGGLALLLRDELP